MYFLNKSFNKILKKNRYKVIITGLKNMKNIFVILWIVFWRIIYILYKLNIKNQFFFSALSKKSLSGSGEN